MAKKYDEALNRVKGVYDAMDDAVDEMAEDCGTSVLRVGGVCKATLKLAIDLFEDNGPDDSDEDIAKGLVASCALGDSLAKVLTRIMEL